LVILVNQKIGELYARSLKGWGYSWVILLWERAKAVWAQVLGISES